MAERTPSITSPSLAEGVDISPISTADRRNSLEKHLQTRPDEQDLKNRHILLDTNTAPALQARQLELERQRATDNLKKGLGKRPERGELVERECCIFLLLVLMLSKGNMVMFLVAKARHNHIPFHAMSPRCIGCRCTCKAIPAHQDLSSSLRHITPVRPYH